MLGHNNVLGGYVLKQPSTTEVLGTLLIPLHFVAPFYVLAKNVTGNNKLVAYDKPNES